MSNYDKMSIDEKIKLFDDKYIESIKSIENILVELNIYNRLIEYLKNYYNFYLEMLLKNNKNIHTKLNKYTTNFSTNNINGINITMNLSKQRENKELFTGERISDVNTNKHESIINYVKRINIKILANIEETSYIVIELNKLIIIIKNYIKTKIMIINKINKNKTKFSDNREKLRNKLSEIILRYFDLAENFLKIKSNREINDDIMKQIIYLKTCIDFIKENEELNETNSKKPLKILTINNTKQNLGKINSKIPSLSSVNTKVNSLKENIRISRSINNLTLDLSRLTAFNQEIITQFNNFIKVKKILASKNFTKIFTIEQLMRYKYPREFSIQGSNVNHDILDLLRSKYVDQEPFNFIIHYDDRKNSLYINIVNKNKVDLVHMSLHSTNSRKPLIHIKIKNKNTNTSYNNIQYTTYKFLLNSSNENRIELKCVSGQEKVNIKIFRVFFVEILQLMKNNII
jgi:hypothetical protein